MAGPLDDIYYFNKETRKLENPIPHLCSEALKFGENFVGAAVKPVKEHPEVALGALTVVGVLAHNPKLRETVVELAECASAKTAVAIDDTVMSLRSRVQIPTKIVGRSDDLDCIEPANSSFSQAFIRARQSVAKVITSGVDTDGERFSGSATAFSVSRDGRFITNYHVVEDAKNLSLIDRFGKSHFANVISTDPHNDLAVLKLERTASCNLFKPLQFGKSLQPGYSLNRGDEAFCFGYPQTDSLTGSIKSNLYVGESEAARYFRRGDSIIPIHTRPGSSGSPVMDAHGDVIGVVKRGFKKGQLDYRSRAVVVPGERAEAFFYQPDVLRKSAESAQPIMDITNKDININ